MISAALAAATPVMTATPLQPPQRKASVSRISDNHSCAVQGAPGIEWLKGSARGTAPWAKIHSPVARCDQVSPSPKTFSEKVDSANRHVATRARARPERRASEVCPLSERAASSRASAIPPPCRRPANIALKSPAASTFADKRQRTKSAHFCTSPPPPHGAIGTDDVEFFGDPSINLSL